MDGESLLLDRARSTPLCQPPSPSQAVAQGAATGEEEEERILERPNAAADEPVDREEEEEEPQPWRERSRTGLRSGLAARWKADEQQ